MRQLVNFEIEMAQERAEEEGLTVAFSFAPDQVKRVYTMKAHPEETGEGLWFQLADGKVFDCLGKQDTSRKSRYSRPIEGQEAHDIAAFAIKELTGEHHGEE